MGRRAGMVASALLLAGLAGVVAAPAVGEAGGAKVTLSMTKDYTASSWTEKTGWGERATAKLGFGLQNALLGWTEILLQPKKALDAGDNFFVGLGTGFKNGVADTLGGVIHTLTFPFTELDAPLPNGGTQLLS